MMKTLVALFALLLFSITSFAADDKSKWTSTDTALQVVFLTTLDIDRAQTIEFTEHPRPEANAEVGWAKNFIGSHPSKGQINGYVATSALLHTAIAYVLPKPYRTIWQSVWIGIELDSIKRGTNVGIGIRF